MKLTERVYLVGSGNLGMNLTNAYDCNVYLLDAGSGLLLVDCGAGLEMARILEEIRRDGMDPKNISHIIVTHAHADHAGGAAGLKRYTDAKVICSPRTAAILETGDEEAIHLPECRKIGMYPRDYRFESCSPSIAAENGEIFEIGDISMEIVFAPGHSADMICCYVKQWKSLFCGDLLFAGGRIAMQTSPDFSFFELSQSVRKLSGYDVESLFPGHLAPVICGGAQVIEKVKETFDAMRIPPNIV